jgi:hypothetical protein
MGLFKHELGIELYCELETASNGVPRGAHATIFYEVVLSLLYELMDSSIGKHSFNNVVVHIPKQTHKAGYSSVSKLSLGNRALREYVYVNRPTLCIWV